MLNGFGRQRFRRIEIEDEGSLRWNLAQMIDSRQQSVNDKAGPLANGFAYIGQESSLLEKRNRKLQQAAVAALLEIMSVDPIKFVQVEDCRALGDSL